MSKAADGSLLSPDVRQAEVSRLLGSEASVDALSRFVGEWLGMDPIPGIEKNAELFDAFTDELPADLDQEWRATVRAALFEGDGLVSDLFTTSSVYANERTAPLYGTDPSVVASMSEQFSPLQLDPSERRGILSQAAFLSAHSAYETTSAPARGLFITEQLLCETVPEPPPNVANAPPPEGEDIITERQRLEAHSSEPACASCHKFIDPAGLALEKYDALGQYRETDGGEPIDPSGQLAIGERELSFTNFVDLTQQLSAAPEVHECVARQFIAFASGTHRDDAGECVAKTASKAYIDQGLSLEALVSSVLAAPAFITRSR